MFALINNRRGIILATSYMMVAALVILGSAFVSRSVAEKNAAERGRDLKSSFWAAEAGLQEALWNLRTNPTWTTLPHSTNELPYTVVLENFGEGDYRLIVSDIKEDSDIDLVITNNSVIVTNLEFSTNPSKKKVICIGNVNGVLQQIEVELRLIPPAHPAFDDTLASGGNLDFWGAFAYAYAYGQTRLTGRYYGHGFIAGMGFEDKDEGVAANQTTVTYPDGETDANTTDGDFEDFVDYYRDTASSLPAGDVVYMTTDSTVNVHPFSFRGKKLVFVEGSAPGTGNVNILFDGGTWGSNDDLTIVSTGEINYFQPLQSPSGEARLSTVSWGNFVEGSIIWSYHRSAIHTQGQASFMHFASLRSTMKGTVIANEGVGVYSAASLKGFQYCSRLEDGDDVPPGFHLPGGAGNYTLGDPVDWQQL